jgi:hypothetical protein
MLPIISLKKFLTFFTGRAHCEDEEIYFAVGV